MGREDGKEEENDKQSGSAMSTLVRQKAWEPSFYFTTSKEIYYYAGHEICIWESLDSYGAIIWPAALALCQYLDTNRGTVNLLDKAVLEIGAGTGLVSIVASLLGAWVTAGDLPEVMSNLRGNLSRNTRGRCRYTPQAVALSWGHEMEQTFPRSVYRYDYVLAADVVYHHDSLSELLLTMHHFCQPGTTIIWANKIRFGSDLIFIENFKKAFHTVLLADMGEVKIYSATTKDFEEGISIPVMSKEAFGQEERNRKERGRNSEEGDGIISKAKKQGQDPEGADLKPQFRQNLNQWQKEAQVDANRELKQESGMSKNIEEEQQVEWKLDKNSPVAENPLSGRNEQKTWAKHRDVEGPGGINNTDCQTQEKSEYGDDIQNCTESYTETDMVKNSECIDSERNAQRTWMPNVYYKLQKEIHYFMGHKIAIEESIDSYGGMIWPAAIALCKFLETPAGQQKIDLVDKETLELGAGTGLLSIVATLLGAKLTATDLPEILGNLRCNLNRNTRGHRRHEPRVAALSWGHDLEETFPCFKYHYDYVLAADVVYHHDYLTELLFTMRYFCQPGTNLIWANKVRYPSDLVFIENFKKSFHHTLIAELDDVRIYLATHREANAEDRLLKVVNKEEAIEDKNSYRNEEMRNYTKQNEEQEEKEKVLKQEYIEERPGSEGEGITADKEHTTGEKTQTEQDYGNGCIKWNKQIDVKETQSEELVGHQQKDENEGHCKKEGKYTGEKETGSESVGRDQDSQDCSESESSSTQTQQKGSAECLEINGQLGNQRTWEPSFYYTPSKEIHYFMGHKISIEESYDSYGAMIWPAAIALCKFLETPAGRHEINLLDKSVLEIGAGTGLLSIVATLLGAKLTATDLPEILSNLRCNLNRNTRWIRRHEPQVMELYWGQRLEESFPHSTHHYDYVLAADVVYHHDFLAELLDTMHYFCQPGTSLIWANKIRYPSDLIFIENFNKMFHTTLIADSDEVKIYRATHKSLEENIFINWKINEEEGDEEEEEKKQE
ncbi:hypothetical protein P4O66_021479 [Electrophorus voltai]|uniref:Uncharacterized protein n=1 Tax=Electrophorus voltai TaxID=2609070 RepID=A0AAD8ZP65_9TELE|nr:hypothetical protein P4O66_021479 [Electrophorus voltai]